MNQRVSASGPHAAQTRALRGLIEVTRLTRSAGSLSRRLELGVDSEELFRRADEAMYEAKRSEGNVAVAA